jgi:hypothetical protein
MGVELRLDSTLSQQIANEQLDEISTFELNQLAELTAKYTFGVTQRSGPTPRYNCHGLTLACRRTGIFEAVTVIQALDHDGYREVTREQVQPGDLILYADTTGDLEHSGIVVVAPLAERLYIPMVLSKWGKGPELIHPGNHCPYNFSTARYYRVYAT